MYLLWLVLKGHVLWLPPCDITLTRSRLYEQLLASPDTRIGGVFENDLTVHLPLAVHLSRRKDNTEQGGHTVPKGQIHPTVWTLHSSALFWAQNYKFYKKCVGNLSCVPWPRQNLQINCKIWVVSVILDPKFLILSGSKASQKLYISSSLQNFRCVGPTPIHSLSL